MKTMKIFGAKGSNRERGVSLIEGVLYLVIALAVIVGGIVYFQQAQVANHAVDVARANISFASQIRGLYQNQERYGWEEDITDVIVKSGVVPSNFQGPGGTVVHPFGGSVFVSGGADGFAITYTNVTEEGCQRLASVGDDGTGPMGTGMAGIGFSDDAATLNQTGDVWYLPDAFVNTDLDYRPAPVSAEDASHICSDGVDMIFYFDAGPGVLEAA